LRNHQEAKAPRLGVAAKVVLDTNALLIPFESGIRLEAELERLFGTYEAIVPEAVMLELAHIASQGKGQRAANARMALSLASRYSYRPVSGRGDSAVLSIAKKEKAYLFTNDRELLNRAFAEGLGVVRVKGKSHLIVETRQGETR
jgi:uncharacterized protein